MRRYRPSMFVDDDNAMVFFNIVLHTNSVALLNKYYFFFSKETNSTVRYFPTLVVHGGFPRSVSGYNRRSTINGIGACVVLSDEPASTPTPRVTQNK